MCVCLSLSHCLCAYSYCLIDLIGAILYSLFSFCLFSLFGASVFLFFSGRFSSLTALLLFFSLHSLLNCILSFFLF